MVDVPTISLTGVDAVQLSCEFSMPAALRFAIKLRLLQALKRQLDDEYTPKFAAARAQGDWDTDNKLFLEWRMIADEMEGDIGQLQTARLKEIAERLLIPVPDFDGNSGQWVESQPSGRWHLSPEASHELRAAIRREQKERRDVWLPYVAAGGAAVSIIGAVVSWWLAFS